MSADLLSEGRALLRALRPPPSTEVELYLESERDREVAWAEGRPEDTAAGASRGLSVRVVREGRQGFAYSNDVSSGTARRLLEKAASAAELAPRDEFRALYAPNGAAPAAGATAAVDRSLFRASVGDLQSRLAAAEKTLLKSDRRIKKVLKLTLRETAGETAILNTRGVAARKPFSSSAFAVELMGESKKEVQVGWDFAETRFARDLDVDAVLDGVRDHVLGSFGGKPLDSGSWPVIFRPRVGVEFIELLSEALCADVVQHGRSFFAGKKDRRVGSALVTLIDDARYPKGLVTAPFDDEGCPTRTNVLVEDGVLKEFLYDSYSARKEGRASTGNAGRIGVGGTPSPDSSNFYLRPGATPAARIASECDRAFIVLDAMGMHTADAVSGDFSVGATGLLVEKGRVARPVKGVTLAGNLLELVRRIDAVGDDLTWYGPTGAPTFRVSGLSVGGN